MIYPKISIITVCLNSENYIEKCLLSVANQNYPKKKIEHIVIDGGSTDNTVNIIKKYSKNLKYWHTKKDKGLYDAMNIGIKKSKGDLIGILNSDDYFYKNSLKTVAKYFSNKKIDYLFGSVMKNRIFHNFFPEKIYYKFNIYPSHSISFFISRNAQNIIGKYDLKFENCSDRDFIFRLIRSKFKGTCTKKNEVLGKFNMFGKSSKLGFYKKNFEEIKIRINNKQNIFKILILFVLYNIYYVIIISLKKFIK